jgi:RHS repeat-associated protein
MKKEFGWVVIPLLTSLLGIAQAQPGKVTYVYSDPQGTPLAEADASGNITATFEYTPYGTYAPAGTAHPAPPPNGPGYTGHVNDPDTSLAYMQARYYDPAIGRFLSADPVKPSAGNAFDFNRYSYANDNPQRYIDPDGRTCTQVDKTYTCQIDKIVTQVNGKTVTRDATAEDHKTYAAVEKSLTKAVNTAASSGKTANISFTSGGTTYSFSIPGASVAKNLATRTMSVNAADPGAMSTVGNVTTIGKFGLQPGDTVVGNEEKTRQIDFLHEGIHRTREEKGALGLFGSRQMSNDQDAHQESYNAAATLFLGPDQ